MNIENKDFQTNGQISILQFQTLYLKLWEFYPGGPAIEKGDLIIEELDEEGTVGELRAINRTDKYLFIMDTDILLGAKQNRVLNTSVLFAPRSRTKVAVSCVERSRWRSNSPGFRMGNHHIESNIRYQKATTIKPDPEKNRTSAMKFQSDVWDSVASECAEASIDNPTEDYDKILTMKTERKDDWLKDFKPDKKANGLAVFAGKDIVSMDIFGSQHVYDYYFPRLIQNADTNPEADNKSNLTKENALGLVVDYISTQNPAQSEFFPVNSGIGRIRQFDDKKITGSDLVFEDQAVHTFILSRKQG